MVKINRILGGVILLSIILSVPFTLFLFLGPFESFDTITIILRSIAIIVIALFIPAILSFRETTMSKKTLIVINTISLIVLSAWLYIGYIVLIGFN